MNKKSRHANKHNTALQMPECQCSGNDYRSHSSHLHPLPPKLPLPPLPTPPSFLLPATHPQAQPTPPLTSTPLPPGPRASKSNTFSQH